MSSHLKSSASNGRRTVKKVPFVELFGGRVQGVVSSGSDLERVYVSFLDGQTRDYYCCTNNNRPCGGLRGSPCKHIQLLVSEAMEQFGSETVNGYLGLEPDADPFSPPIGGEQKESPGIVFSRFLSYLRTLELETARLSVPEMDWFAS